MQGNRPSADRVGIGASNHVSLEPWEELSGTLQRIEEHGNTLAVVLSTGTLVFDAESIEGTTLAQQLETEVGADVSILRTGTPPNSIRVVVGRSESPDE